MIDRIKLGDENTKYFHSTATISYRKNFIAQLSTPCGRVVTEHDGKAALFWIGFKDRMGATTVPDMSL